nr:hypothetical protein RKHAN_02709 [Rhizobium sp. Khangiran2]
MRADYKSALQAAGYQDNTIASQLHRVGKVEQYYGDLDELIASGGYEALISELTYSTADERLSKPNPSKIQFDGNIRNNLQSYKNAVVRYFQFLQSGGPTTEAWSIEGEAAVGMRTGTPTISDGFEKQRLSLERDLQSSLRSDISSLEEGLVVVDDGIERGVLSGFIDILCRDSNGRLVVVELKAGKADARVIAQTLGYMGDLMEEERSEIRGIIVAHEFDQRTRSAVKAVPNLALFRYSISFRFDREND